MADGITRREFLKGTSAVITGVVVLDTRLSAAEGGSGAAGNGTAQDEC